MRKISILFLFLFILAAVLSFKIFPRNSANAGAGDNISGWAWGENTGWISFNCVNCENNPICDKRAFCDGEHPDYGVDIGEDMILSGYAWSENIGWISFNQADLSDCPSPPCRAWLSLTGELNGWAKALAGGSAQAAGWDGWINFNGDNYNVALNLNTREFEGWAWGDNILGWISFNCNNPETGNVCGVSDYKVITTFSLPPTAVNLAVSSNDFCSIPYQDFTWQFQDSDPGDAQSAYELQVDDQGTFVSFPAGTFNSGKITSSASEVPVLVVRALLDNELVYNRQYFWRVKVWDNNDTESDWVYGGTSGTMPGVSFTTPLHIFPTPDFTWTPQFVSEEEFAQFCSTKEAGVCDDDVSTCYDINNNQISCSGRSFQWTFPDNVEFATGSSAIVENPKLKFNDSGAHNISLRITDDAGSCSSTKQINVSLPLPIWKEISP